MTNPFHQDKINCPRCLGKGRVTEEDIRRLNKQFEWLPDSCALCEGKGMIHPDLLSKTGVGYLSTDLSPGERQQFIDDDEAAIQAATEYDLDVENFVTEVRYLSGECKLDAEKITGFYFLHHEPEESNQEERIEMLELIRKIIASRKHNG